MSWATLGRRARTFRVVHAAWSVVGLTTLAYIWFCAATGRRDRWLWASVTFLSIEGAALVVGRGDCPMGPLQEEWGDPVPFFELVLPPRAAKAAVPVLAGAAVAGILAVVLPCLRSTVGSPRLARYSSHSSSKSRESLR